MAPAIKGLLHLSYVKLQRTREGAGVHKHKQYWQDNIIIFLFTLSYVAFKYLHYILFRSEAIQTAIDGCIGIQKNVEMVGLS